MKEILFATGLAAMTVLAPIQSFIITISFFVFFDTLFGVYASIKLGGKAAFRSNLLFNVVIKSFFYMGVILLGFLIDVAIFEGSLMGVTSLVSKLLTLVFCYIEIKSLDETSIRLGNKSFWIILKELIGKGKEFKKDISKLTSMDDEDEKENNDSI